MNYKKIYNSLIQKRKITSPVGYSEEHHIIPKSLGGANNSDNRVRLTAREHFIAHLLLTKCFTKGSIAWIKMQKAFNRMFDICEHHNRYCPSKWYEITRKDFSKAQSLSQQGYKNSQYGKVWVYHEGEERSLSIPKEELDDYLTAGWKQGRIIDWVKHKNAYYVSKKRIAKIEQNKEDRRLRILQNVKTYTEYYEIYKKYGWEYFKEVTGYTKSKSNLVSMMAKYVVDFVPQNGKRRG